MACKRGREWGANVVRNRDNSLCARGLTNASSNIGYKRYDEYTSDPLWVIHHCCGEAGTRRLMAVENAVSGCWFQVLFMGIARLATNS